MKFKWRIIYKSNFFKSVLNLSSGTSLAYLITIAISPVLTRLFTPEDFGLLQFFQSSIIICTPIVTGCYYYTLVTEKDAKRINALIKGISYLTIASTLIITTIATLVFFTLNILSDHLLLVTIGFPIILILNALTIAFDYFFIQSNHYTNISLGRIFRSGSTSLTQSLFGLNRLSGGLLYGFMIGKIVNAIYYLWRVGKNNLIAIYSSQIRTVKEVLSENVNQPLYILPTTIVSSGATELVIFIIASLFGGYELGLYSLAYRVISIPSLLIGTSIGDVFFKESSSLILQSKSIISLTLKTWFVLFGIAVLPMSALWLYGPEIITAVFGSTWKVTGQITTILAPYILFSFMSSSTGKLFISLNKQNFSFYFTLLIFVARISGLFLGYYYGGFIFAVSLMIAFHFISLLIYNMALFKQLFSYEKSLITP